MDNQLEETFPLKTMENFIERHIKVGTLLEQFLRNIQHSYEPSELCQTALQNLTIVPLATHVAISTSKVRFILRNTNSSSNEWKSHYHFYTIWWWMSN